MITLLWLLVLLLQLSVLAGSTMLRSMTLSWNPLGLELWNLITCLLPNIVHSLELSFDHLSSQYFASLLSCLNSNIVAQMNIRTKITRTCRPTSMLEGVASNYFLKNVFHISWKRQKMSRWPESRCQNRKFFDIRLWWEMLWYFCWQQATRERKKDKIEKNVWYNISSMKCRRRVIEETCTRPSNVERRHNERIR